MGYTLLKLIFALLCGLVGLVIGIVVSHHLPGLDGQTGIVPAMRDIGLPIVMGLIFVAISPWVVDLFQHAAHTIEEAIVTMAPGEVLSGTVGLVAGLFVAFFVRDLFQPIRQLPYFGGVIAFIIYALITMFFSYIGVRIGLRHRAGAWSDGVSIKTEATAKLLDTSVIVDGRILEIVQAGFIEGQLLVPKFVLKELQTIADSADGIRRARGRRGLEVLNRLRESSGTLEIIDQDPPERDVDGKLVAVARLLNLPILTNDYNLNRVAKLQDVIVMNINELANAIKPVVLPGEEMAVNIVKDGKEQNQGVGYLDDGTMIVVENGRRLIGETIGVQVTSVLQTAAGRMIFAKPKKA